MTSKRLLLPVLACSVACSSMAIRSDWDRNVDFSPLKAYAWTSTEPQGSNPNPSQMTNTLLDQRVTNAVNETLVAKGYAISGEQEPDFFVRYKVSAKDVVQIRSIHPRSTGEWGAQGDVETYSYVEGTLVLDILAPDQKTLLWRGWAEAELYPDLSPEKREERIREAVTKILKKFPPQKS